MVIKGNHSNFHCAFARPFLCDIFILERLDPVTVGDRRNIIADIFDHGVRFDRVYPDAGRTKISAGNTLVMEGDYRSDWQDRGFVSGRSFYGKYSEYDFAVSGWGVTSDRMGSKSALVERTAVWYNMLGWD